MWRSRPPRTESTRSPTSRQARRRGSARNAGELSPVLPEHPQGVHGRRDGRARARRCAAAPAACRGPAAVAPRCTRAARSPVRRAPRRSGRPRRSDRRRGTDGRPRARSATKSNSRQTVASSWRSIPGSMPSSRAAKRLTTGQPVRIARSSQRGTPGVVEAQHQLLVLQHVDVHEPAAVRAELLVEAIAERLDLRALLGVGGKQAPVGRRALVHPGEDVGGLGEHLVRRSRGRARSSRPLRGVRRSGARPGCGASRGRGSPRGPAPSAPSRSSG